MIVLPGPHFFPQIRRSYFSNTRDVRTPLRNTTALWASPNPFNPLTVVHYSVPQPGHVRLDIYDARGARVTTLVDREHHAGSFTAAWRGVDDAGQPVSSGVYFARLTTPGTVSNTKLVLVK
jgi:FlgD Ig-like domain